MAPTAGMLRYNTDNKRLERSTDGGGTWVELDLTGEILIPGPSISSVYSAVLVKTSGYTIVSGDGFNVLVLVSTNVNITLPTAVGVTGKVITVKKTDAIGTVDQLLTTSSQTIDGIASGVIKLYSLGDSITVVSNGTNWNIIDENITIHFSAKMSSSQIVSSGVANKVQFNSEIIDTANSYDSSVNYRFTAPRSGLYQCESNADFDGPNGSLAYFYMAINGVAQFYHVIRAANSSDSFPISNLVKLNLNDYLEVFGVHNRGSNTSTEPNFPFFSATYIRRY